MSYTTVVGNYYGFHQSPGAAIRSLGNNHITDNVANAGVLTPAALQ